MAWTEAEREALRRSIAQGVRSVDYGGRRVEYASLDEMSKLLARMDEELAAAAGTPRPRYFLGSSSKGV